MSNPLGIPADWVQYPGLSPIVTYVPPHWVTLDEGRTEFKHSLDRPPTSIVFSNPDSWTKLGLPYEWAIDFSRWNYAGAPAIPVPLPSPPVSPPGTFVPPMGPWVGGLIGVGVITSVNTLQNAFNVVSAAIGIINDLGAIVTELQGMRDRLVQSIATLTALMGNMNCGVLPAGPKEICEKCLKKIKDLLTRMWNVLNKLDSLIDNIKFSMGVIRDAIYAGTISNLIQNFANCVAVSIRERDRMKGLWGEMLKAWGAFLDAAKECRIFVWPTSNPPGDPLPGGIVHVILDSTKTECSANPALDPATSPFFDLSRDPDFVLPSDPVWDADANALHFADGLGFTIQDVRSDVAALVAAWPTNP